MLILTDTSIGSASTISSSTLAKMSPSVGVIISSKTALLNSIAILITNEYITKLKIKYTKLSDWINLITLLYEKVLKESLVDEKTDDKEAQELKKKFIIISLIKDLILRKKLNRR